MRAESESALDRLRADIAWRGEYLIQKMSEIAQRDAKRDAENAKWEKRFTQTVIITVGIATAILGVLIIIFE